MKPPPLSLRHRAPIVDRLRNTGESLIATIEGIEVELTTFREGLWLQGVVYLPPPFTDRCRELPIFCDAYDHHSDLMAVNGCIFDREVALWMKDFASGILPKGELR